VDPEVAREIEAAVGEQLGNFGVSGTVVFQGRQIELHGSGPPMSIDVEHVGEQWALLPPEMRARKASELARRLVQAHRAAGALGPPEPRGIELPVRLIAIVTGAAVLVAVAAFFGFRLLRAEPPVEAAPVIQTETDEQTAARQARVCEAARKRIYSGASMGALDTEGWVVELWLATRQPPGSEALVELVSEGRLSPKADVDLAALSGARAEVTPGFTAEEEGRFPGWRAITLRLSGRYVDAYLDPGTRSRFIALAERAADVTKAELGALYGRCAHLTHRELGAWYRGVDAPAAAASLVYAAGFFAEQPAVSRSTLDALTGPSPLDALRAAAGKLDAESLGRLLGAEGGSITPGAGGAITVTFPVGGPIRATRASRIVAQKLDLRAGAEGK